MERRQQRFDECFDKNEMKKLTYPCNIDEAGKTDLNRDSFRDGLGKFAGKRVKISIEEDRDAFIDSDRGYYWASVLKDCIRAVNDCGYSFDENDADDLEDMHLWLKDNVLKNGYTKTNSFGEEITMPASTKRLDGAGWRDYLDKIKIQAWERWHWVLQPKRSKGYFPEKEF